MKQRRIVVGWHPSWKEAGRRKKGRRRRTREHSGISSISRAKQQMKLARAIIRVRSEDFELDYFRASTTERERRAWV